MKNNYLLIFVGLFIISLVFNKLSWPGAGILLTLSTTLLVIAYVYKLFRSKDNPTDLKLIIIESFIYLIFTLIGLLFRHHFWYFPFWYELYKYVWPIFSLIIIVQLIIVGKTRLKTLTKEYKKTLFKEIIIPIVVIIMVATPTFLTRTENFVKIFKSYTYEELINRWNNEKK
jgi:hypothetical protein